MPRGSLPGLLRACALPYGAAGAVSPSSYIKSCSKALVLIGLIYSLITMSI